MNEKKGEKGGAPGSQADAGLTVAGSLQVTGGQRLSVSHLGPGSRTTGQVSG